MSKDLPEGLAFKEELNLHRYCNGNLNFSTVSHEDEDYGYQKKKIMRDPMSHRIIEKRRRDRMNNCLADLSRLIPPDYLKKGRGRIEKTEIIEMAIKHMRHLQSIIASSRANVSEGQCDIAAGSSPDGSSSREFGISATPTTHPHQPIIVEHYRLGYLECLSEAMHFLVEVQGYFAGDSLCVQMINHLHKHCDKILKSDSLNHPIKHMGETSSNSSVSPTNANYSNNSPPLGLSVSNGSNSDDNQPSHPYGSGRTFEPIDDPLRNVGFRSPRRYSDMSSGDSKKACESYCPRYSEPESERISENPSDSDVEQGYAAGGRTKDTRGYLNSFDDDPRCNGVDCLPMNCSSSSGIGSTPGYTPPYDEFIVKEENGPSQLRDMLTSPKVVHGNGMHPVRMPELKTSMSPTPQHFLSETSPVHQNQARQGGIASEDAANFKAQDLTMEAECAAIQELNQENSESNTPDTHGNMYKFKNNIKQRFSKERKNHESDEEIPGKRIKLNEVTLCKNDPMGGRKCDPLMKERLNLLNKGDVDCDSRKRNRYLSESEMRIQTEIDDISNRLSFGHKTNNRSKKWEESVKYSRLKLSPPYATPETPIEYRGMENGRKPIGLLAITEYLSTEQSAIHRYGIGDGDGGVGVPIFALHSKGSFYIPLTLDQSVLAPFLSLLGLTKTEEVEDKPVLHPVTISVNFQTSYIARNPKQGAIPWK